MTISATLPWTMSVYLVGRMQAPRFAHQELLDHDLRTPAAPDEQSARATPLRDTAIAGAAQSL